MARQDIGASADIDDLFRSCGAAVTDVHFVTPVQLLTHLLVAFTFRGCVIVIYTGVADIGIG